MNRTGQATAVDGSAVLLQASSLLLSYPSPACAHDLKLVAAALAELPPGRSRRSLERFLQWWGDIEAGARERMYVATFDLDPDVSLYLTVGLPRTSRERGAALLELRRTYRSAGVDVTCDELPDYLPLMLEAGAQAPACRELLAAHHQALEALRDALERRESPFALVIDALLEEARV